MAKETLIRISVYPYIRKYLLAHYTEGLLNPRSNGDTLSGILVGLLERMPQVEAATFRRPHRVDHGAVYSFRISRHMGTRYGNYISSISVHRFNNLVRDMVLGEMYRLVLQLVKLGSNTDQAIRHFQELYDFSEDELPFDNLKKWFYRERSKRSLRVVHNATGEAPAELILTYYEERADPNYQPAA